MYACGNWIGQPIRYIVHRKQSCPPQFLSFTFVKGYIFSTNNKGLSHLPIYLLDKPLLPYVTSVTQNDWHKFWICNRRHVMLLSAVGETFDRFITHHDKSRDSFLLKQHSIDIHGFRDCDFVSQKHSHSPLAWFFRELPARCSPFQCKSHTDPTRRSVPFIASVRL